MKLEEMKRIVARLNELRAPAGRVETREEAARMTAEDPVGHVWSVGDKYLLIPIAPFSHLV